jgi:hypothetical protein
MRIKEYCDWIDLSHRYHIRKMFNFYGKALRAKGKKIAERIG